MNKKSMAIEISKHPLIKKIVENNLASTKDVARLIAEEILRESEGDANFYSKINQAIEDTKFNELKALLAAVKVAVNNRYQDDQNKINYFDTLFADEIKKRSIKLQKDATVLVLNTINSVEKSEDLEVKYNEAKQKVLKDMGVDLEKILPAYQDQVLQAYNSKKQELEKETEDTEAEKPTTDDGERDTGETGEAAASGTEETETAEETTTVETNLQDEDFEPLKAAAKEFVENFYEQEFLFQQGKIVKDIMTILIKIMKKEDRIAAVRRTEKEAPETGGITEEETPKEKKDITSVQNALSSLVRIIKRSKKELKEFHEKSGQAKYGADRVKKQLLKSLQSAQNIIAELIQRLKKFVNKKDELAEGIEDEMLEMFQDIEEVYDNVAPRLEFITTASKNSEEVRTQLNNQAGVIIDQLHSISHYFPNVNPFKSKDLPKESKEMFEEYELAISTLLPFVRAILNELGRDTPVSGVINDSIDGLERFSGHIQSIFGVESDIPDIAVDTKTPAATEDPEPSDVEAAEEPVSDEEPTPEVPLSSRFKKQFLRIPAQNIAKIMETENPQMIALLFTILGNIAGKEGKKKISEVLIELPEELKNKSIEKMATIDLKIDKRLIKDAMEIYVEELEKLNPADLSKSFSDLIKTLAKTKEGEEIIKRTAASEKLSDEERTNIEKNLAAIKEKEELIMTVLDNPEILLEPELDVISADIDPEPDPNISDDQEEFDEIPQGYLKDFQQFISDTIGPGDVDVLEEASRITSETSELKTAFLKNLHNYLKDKVDEYKIWAKRQKLVIPTKQYEPLEKLWDEWLKSIEKDEEKAKAIEEKVFQAYRKNFFGKTKLTGKDIKNIFSKTAFEGKEIEEQIANKLKPLVKEILRKQK